MEKQIEQLNTLREPFREVLQSEYLERLKNNPNYSLRAFSQSLGVHSGTLSQILSGKRKVSKSSIKKLGLAIGMPLENLSIYLEEASISPVEPTEEKLDIQKLTVDTFKVISDWYHFAIIELTKMDHFQSDHKWIAKKLGITNIEAQTAIERLQRLEFIKADESGNWTPSSMNFSTLDSDFTNSALKKLQTQILEKAILALGDTDFKSRHQSALTTAVCQEDLPLIEKKINGFRKELNQFLENRPKKDQVYHLSLSFYPVTKNGERK